MVIIKVTGIEKTIKKMKDKLKEEIQLKKKLEMHNLVSKLKEVTPVDTGRARDGWEVKGDKIVNEVPYIDQLNQGSSKQAPSHFVEKTVLSQPGISPSGTVVIYKKPQ